MQKQIHVNSYVKSDGTQVKEHFRNIDTDNYGTPHLVPEEQGRPVIEEQQHNIFEQLFPNLLNPTMNMESAPVLQGGVSVDVGFPTVGGIGEALGSIGGVLGAVVAVSLELAPIALQMYQAMNSGNGQSVEYLKPQFDTKIKQLDTQVAQMKTDIDNKVSKLVNAKNKIEYSKLYEPLQKDWQAYQSVKNFVKKVLGFYLKNSSGFLLYIFEISKSKAKLIFSRLFSNRLIYSLEQFKDSANFSWDKFACFLKILTFLVIIL